MADAQPRVFPSDALMAGVHSAPSNAPKHKKMVSGVLELKKMSAGHRGNPSAYSTGKPKAFTKGPAHG